MHGDLGSTPVLSNSPEGSPSASSTVAGAASPASLADARVLPVSRRGSGGSPAWAAPRLGPRQCASRAAISSGRPNISEMVSLFLFILFSQNCVHD